MFWSSATVLGESWDGMLVWWNEKVSVNVWLLGLFFECVVDLCSLWAVEMYKCIQLTKCQKACLTGLVFSVFNRTPRPSVYIVVFMLCGVLTRLSFYVLLYPNYAFIVSCHLEDEGHDGKRKNPCIVPPCVRLLICQCASCVPVIVHMNKHQSLSLSVAYRSVTGILTGWNETNKQTNDLLMMNSI